MGEVAFDIVVGPSREISTLLLAIPNSFGHPF